MLITKPQLQAINKQTLKYPLDIAEKDYFLTLAVQLLANSPLRQVLVFKGGTALHHCYLPQSRFSEAWILPRLTTPLPSNRCLQLWSRGAYLLANGNRPFRPP